jgi:hypothetical protein
MKESVTYQALVAEGRAEALQEILLELGPKPLGPPDAATRTALRAMADPGHLKKLVERLLDVSSWAELLATPTSRRQKKGRKKRSQS